MPQTNSLVNGTLSEAVEALAQRAADRHIAPQTYAEKRAIAGSDFLSSVGSHLQQNPLLTQSLAGGLGGAAIGGIGTAMQNAGRPADRKRSVLGSTLLGGAAGAALGGGIGAFRQLGGASPPSTEPGKFSIGNKQYQLSPDALKKNPGIVDRVNQDVEGKPLLNRITGGAASMLKLPFQIAPFSSTAALLGIPADLALNSQKLKLGDKIGVGMIDPRNSTDAAHLGAGIDKVIQNPKSFTESKQFTPEQIEVLGRFRGGSSDPKYRKLLESFAKSRNPGLHMDNVTVERETPVPPEMKTVREGVLDPLQPNPKTPAEALADKAEWKKNPDRFREQYVQQPPQIEKVNKNVDITPEHWKVLKDYGAREHAKEHKLPQPALQRHGPWQTQHSTGPWTGTRGIGRFAALAAAPAIEHAMWGKINEMSRNHDLASMLKEMQRSGDVQQVGR